MKTKVNSHNQSRVQTQITTSHTTGCDHIRIAKYLASTGVGSRRKCEELISSGKVRINGEVITSPAIDIDPGKDVVTLKGKILEPQNKVYYLLNKPTGYTCTTADEHAEKLITELVPNNIPVWPVGRLDRETSGLIILTNDGELTQLLTHPKYEKKKKYVARIDKPLNEEQLLQIKNGIELEDGPIKPDEIKTINSCRYEIVIHEGRNRLIRRIFEHFDRKVIELSRIQLSFLNIEDLKLGEYRNLTQEEIGKLKNA